MLVAYSQASQSTATAEPVFVTVRVPTMHRTTNIHSQHTAHSTRHTAHGLSHGRPSPPLRHLTKLGNSAITPSLAYLTTIQHSDASESSFSSDLPFSIFSSVPADWESTKSHAVVHSCLTRFSTATYCFSIANFNHRPLSLERRPCLDAIASQLIDKLVSNQIIVIVIAVLVLMLVLARRVHINVSEA